MNNKYTHQQRQLSQKKFFSNLEYSLSTKGYPRLTIEDIVNGPNTISRPTFYKHFGSLDVLFSTYITELLSPFFTLMPIQNDSVKTAEKKLSSALEHVYNNRGRFIILFSPDNAEYFIRIFYTKLQAHLSQSPLISKEIPELTETFFYDYHAAGTLAIIRNWLQSHIEWPPSKIARSLIKLYSKEQ